MVSTIDWIRLGNLESTNREIRRCSISKGKLPAPAFRREEGRLAMTNGRISREIVENPGVGLSTLTRWLSQDRDAEMALEEQPELWKELKRPRREDEVLKHERDIPKK